MHGRAHVRKRRNQAVDSRFDLEQMRWCRWTNKRRTNWKPRQSINISGWEVPANGEVLIKLRNGKRQQEQCAVENVLLAASEHRLRWYGSGRWGLESKKDKKKIEIEKHDKSTHRNNHWTKGKNVLKRVALRTLQHCAQHAGAIVCRTSIEFAPLQQRTNGWRRTKTIGQIYRTTNTIRLNAFATTRTITMLGTRSLTKKLRCYNENTPSKNRQTAGGLV